MALPAINIPNPASGLGTAVKVVAVVAGGTLIYFKGVKPWLEKRKAEGELKLQQESTLKATDKKKLFDLNGKPILSANLSTIATDIYNGLHPGWYVPTDQARVIRAFKNTPYGYVNKLEEIYLKQYGENLRTTMADKLSDVNWIQVKFLFR